jgi:hypothetical protein
MAVVWQYLGIRFFFGTILNEQAHHFFISSGKRIVIRRVIPLTPHINLIVSQFCGIGLWQACLSHPSSFI